MAKLDVPQLIGLGGIVLASIAGQLNEQVLNLALPDIAGAAGMSRDQSAWLPTLFLTGETLGMASAPSLGLGFSFRRFALFAVAANVAPSLIMAANPSVPTLLLFRFFQGVGLGFVVPLLLTIALRVLGPPIRLYGLAVYALTATFTPNLAAGLAALWIEKVQNFRFIFLESAPLCALAAAAVWWGLKQEPPQRERRAHFDFPGLVLIGTGFASLSIVMEQGDRYDWFDSPLICALAVVSLLCAPAFILVERDARCPLVHLSLLKRRNFAYAFIVLLAFLVIALSASQVPITFLEQVAGYKPLQAYTLTLEVALAQLVLLPATALLLEQTWIDARLVNAIGFVCILVACWGGAHVDSTWLRGQFVVWQAFQAVGFAFVVMPLLMFATNALKPEDGPFGSAMVNASRVAAQAVGAGLLSFVGSRGGDFHRAQIVEIFGQNRFALARTGLLPGDGGALPPVEASALNAALQREVATLTTIDSYLLLGAMAVGLLILLAVLPRYSPPPRIALAGH